MFCYLNEYIAILLLETPRAEKSCKDFFRRSLSLLNGDDEVYFEAGVAFPLSLSLSGLL